MRHPMFGVALAVLAASVILGNAPAQAAGDAAKGKVAFTKYGCWQCHGFEGQGSPATSNGKVLAPDPLPWEGFSAFIRTSNTGMPPFSEKVLPNCRPRGHLRLSVIDPEAEGSQEHSAAQPVTAAARLCQNDMPRESGACFVVVAPIRFAVRTSRSL